MAQRDRDTRQGGHVEPVGPSPALRILSVIVIVAMILASASLIVTLSEPGVRTGMGIFVVAVAVVGLLVWLWNRRGRPGDGDVPDRPS